LGQSVRVSRRAAGQRSSQSNIKPRLSRATYWFGVLVVFFLALASLMPLYWMVTGSFKLQSNAMAVPPEWFPAEPTLENYRKLLFATTPTFRWLLNSVIVAGGVALLAVSTSLLAGYAFGKKRFPGQTVLFWLLIITMMMPRQISLIPLYILMQRLGWFNTYQGMIAPYLAYPFGIFLIRQFMQGIPNDLIDAARIDGASELGIFWYVIVPLSKPAIGALAIFAFMAAWNDYIWQLLMITKRQMLTLPVGVSKLTAALGQYDLGLAMAGATFAFVPMLFIFLIFQDFFVKGITVGAVKG
jgi:multiple sugar transport system permease protein